MKSIKILIMCFCIILLSTQNVYALGDILNMGEEWVNLGLNEAEKGKTMNTDALKIAMDSLYNLLLALATAAAVIVGAIMGIQFMTAGIDKKVQVKESLFPYMISCIVVFGSLGIWRLAVVIMNQI